MRRNHHNMPIWPTLPQCGETWITNANRTDWQIVSVSEDNRECVVRSNGLEWVANIDGIREFARPAAHV